jgi:hypothetical protein
VSQVRKFQPENKLAKTLTDPNGTLVTQAIKKASENIEKVRDEHMAALEIKLDALATAASTATQSQSAEDAAILYRLAREVLGDAGIFGLKHICRASHSLCELMAAGDRHRHQWAGVAVHVEALAILGRGGKTVGGPEIDAMLAGLEKISRAPV